MSNMLPLETFRALFGIHPAHFWGLSNASWAAVNSKCNTVVKEHAWQDANAVGRQEIRDAIEAAEARLREHLGYSVAPRYSSQELAWPRGMWPTVQLREGYVQAAGTETLTLLGEVAVTPIDADGDGVFEAFSASVVTTETDPDRLAVYFSETDRLNGESAGERWRIAPVSIAIVDGGATVRGSRWLLVTPITYEGLAAATLDPGVDATFVSSVAVYTRTTIDPQATLTWETAPYPWFCSCATDNSADPAATATAAARVAIRDGVHGIVAPAEAVYDATSGTWSSVLWTGCRWPDRVTINYLAGVPLVNGQMDRDWQVIVARLAAAELTAPICACATANHALHTWQFDVARTGGGNDEAYGAVSPEDLSNPFGTRRGHIYAWKRVKRLSQARGFLPG